MSKKPDPLAAEARNELQRGLRVFKAFEHADKALAVLENLEQLTGERQKAADAALAAYNEATAAKDGAEADLKAARTEAREMRAKARSGASAIVEKATAEANAITAEARGALTAIEARTAEQMAALKANKTALDALLTELIEAQETIAKAAKLREAMAGV